LKGILALDKSESVVNIDIRMWKLDLHPSTLKMVF
jgi:hypothetical protein